MRSGGATRFMPVVGAVECRGFRNLVEARTEIGASVVVVHGSERRRQDEPAGGDLFRADGPVLPDGE